MASSPTDEMTDSQADRAMSEGEDDDVEDGAKMPPPISREPTPEYLNKKNHPALANQLANHPTAAAPGAAAALIPIRSASSQLVEQMRSADVSASSAAPEAGASVPAGPASSADAPAAGAKSAEAIESESESDAEDDTRTDEQKEKDKLAEDIAVEIARLEAAGYTFSKRTKWAAVAAYLDAKALFDDEGLDITICANEKKKIGDAAVRAKIAELRAAEEEKRKTGQLVVGGESQFDFGSEGEEDEPKPEDEPEVPHPP
tara:strand:- start:225 stop:1001 length:777 start_codon:yes stop_codon:yes gene_type:complete